MKDYSFYIALAYGVAGVVLAVLTWQSWTAYQKTAGKDK